MVTPLKTYNGDCRTAATFLATIVIPQTTFWWNCLQVFCGVQHFHKSLFSGMSIAVKSVVLLIAIPLDAIVLLGINLIIKNCQFLSFYGAENIFLFCRFRKNLLPHHINTDRQVLFFTPPLTSLDSVTLMRVFDKYPTNQFFNFKVQKWLI